MVGVQSLLRWSCSWGTQRTPSRSEPLQIHKYWFLFAIINAFVTYKKSLEGAKTSESYRHLIGLVILITSWKKRQDYFRANVTNMEWDDNYFCPIIFRSRQKLYFSVIVLEGNIWLLSYIVGRKVFLWLLYWRLFLSLSGCGCAATSYEALGTKALVTSSSSYFSSSSTTSSSSTSYSSSFSPSSLFSSNFPVFFSLYYLLFTVVGFWLRSTKSLVFVNIIFMTIWHWHNIWTAINSWTKSCSSLSAYSVWSSF